jgi:hypothetical protein
MTSAGPGAVIGVIDAACDGEIIYPCDDVLAESSPASSMVVT